LAPACEVALSPQAGTFLGPSLILAAVFLVGLSVSMWRLAGGPGTGNAPDQARATLEQPGTTDP
jgi:hypothetical protein